MTITAYQVNSVLNAYTRQSKVRVSPVKIQDDSTGGKYKDIVSLSGAAESKAEELEKISYNLRDVILNDRDL